MTAPRDRQDPRRIRDGLDELAMLELGQETRLSVLQKVVDLVQGVMPDGTDVSLTLLRDGLATTAACTGPRALQLDEVQYASGHGPCLEAAVGGEAVEISDGPTERRWPEYMPAFLDSGALSSLTVPVRAAQLSAALNVYAPAVDAFSMADRRAVARFAEVAAVALSNLDTLHDARGLAEDLRVAMEFRSVIEQAKGILIERHRLTADGAFRLLADASMHTHTKLRDVAETLVRTGELTG